MQVDAEWSRDPLTMHTAFAMAKNLHDSLDSLSLEDERKQVSVIICGFVRQIEFREDLEQHLNFLVDCRRYVLHAYAVTLCVCVQSVDRGG